MFLNKLKSIGIPDFFEQRNWGMRKVGFHAVEEIWYSLKETRNINERGDIMYSLIFTISANSIVTDCT